MNYKELKGFRDIEKEYKIVKKGSKYRRKLSHNYLVQRNENNKIISAIEFRNSEVPDTYTYNGRRCGEDEEAYRIERCMNVVECYGLTFLDDTFYFENVEEGNDIYKKLLDEGYVKATKEEFDSYKKHIYDTLWN